MRQYLPIVGPMLPHPPNDAVATDSWAHPMTDVVRRTSSLACVTALIVMPVFVPAVTTDDPTRYGHAIAPDAVSRKVDVRSYRETFTTPIFVPDLTNPVTRLSWQGTAYPERVARLVLPTAAQLAATQNVDPIAPAGPVTGGQSIAVGSYDLWQYQAETTPFVPNVVSDTIPFETIQGQVPPPVRPRSRTSAVAAQTVGVLFVPGLTNPVTDLSWQGTYPDRVDRADAVTQQLSWVSDRFIFTSASPVFLDWTPRYPDRITPRTTRLIGSGFPTHFVVPALPPATGGRITPTGSYLLWQYQALAGPLEVPVVSAPDTTIGWQAYIPAQLLVPRRLAWTQAWAMDQFDPPAVVPPPTEQTWQGHYPAAVRDRIPVSHRIPAFFADAKFIPTVPLEDRYGFRPLYPDLIARAVPRHYHVWAQPHFVVEVPTPVMSWTGLYLDPPVTTRSRKAALHQQLQWPSQIADVTTPITESSWDTYFADQVPGRKPNNYGSVWVAPLYLADVTVVPPISSARAIYPDRIPRKPAVAWQQAWLMDATWTAPVPVTAPALSVAVYPVRVYGKPVPTPHPALGWPPHVLDVTNPVTALSWGPQVPAWLSRRAPYPERLEVFSLPFVEATTPPPVIVDPPRTPFITWNTESLTLVSWNSTVLTFVSYAAPHLLITWNIETRTITTWNTETHTFTSYTSG